MSHDTSHPSGSNKIGEVRYSLKNMLTEVEDERKDSSLKRELVDTNEIGKMFTERKRKKK